MENITREKKTSCFSLPPKCLKPSCQKSNLTSFLNPHFRLVTYRYGSLACKSYRLRDIAFRSIFHEFFLCCSSNYGQRFFCV
jgi:hypothetical protein